MFFGALTIVSGIILCVIFGVRHRQIVEGRAIRNDGLGEFLDNTTELYLYLKKVGKYLRKILFQYTFHFFVRVLYYIHRFWNNVYIIARDKFMSDAVKDKKTVGRFWDYLKEYKVEKERENDK